MQPRVFKTFSLPKNISFEVDFLQRYCGTLKPRAFITDGYFIDIGIPEALERAGRELSTTA